MLTLAPPPGGVRPRYKWVALSNTTLGILLASLNSTSLIISLPVIFRGLHVNPLAAISFGLFLALPVNFSYLAFASVLFVNGLAFGMFASPNTAGIMNCLPARFRGVGSGMRSTFQNTGTPISIGIFFSLMILGLSSRAPAAMLHGLVTNGLPVTEATKVSHLPAVGYLFAAFLGYNPLKSLLGTKLLGTLPAHDAATLVSRHFFPSLIAEPFRAGLEVVFIFALVMCVIAAGASWLRGGHYVFREDIAETDGERQAA